MADLRQRMTLIASLYVAQAVPLGFFIVAVPAIMRKQGLSLEQTGMLSALAFPWLIKFLWAPLVDRWGSGRLGHYRSWIIPLQTLSMLIVVALSQVDIARGLTWLVVAGALFMLTSATQDVATDGLAVRIVRRDERGSANGIQVGGYYLGQILGGGLVLVLYDRVGWSGAVLAMAVMLALPLIPAARFREPEFESRRPTMSIDLGALREFARRPGAGVWILILVVYRAGEAMALTMLNPLLVDHGLSLEAIGLTLGLAGSAAAFAGAIVGGLWIRRIGRKRALVVFGVVQALALVGFLFPARGFLHPAAILTVAAVAAFAGGMATTALYTNMMDRCDPHTAASDFTLQQSLSAVGPIFAAAFSGFSAAGLGYPAHFVLCALLALGAPLLAARRLEATHAAPVALDAAVDARTA